MNSKKLGLVGMISIAGLITFSPNNLYASEKGKCVVNAFPGLYGRINTEKIVFEVEKGKGNVALFGERLIGVNTKKDYWLYSGNFTTNCDVRTEFKTPKEHKAYLNEEELVRKHLK